MQKTYNADQIIKQLSNLHPNFYPVPSEQKIIKTDPVTGKLVEVEVVPIESGFLTKDDLLNLYGECGNYLHRGSIRQLLTKWGPTLDFGKISEWTNKIIKLLGHHQIQTIQPDKQLWVLMHDKDDGKVHWTIMQQVSKSC